MLGRSGRRRSCVTHSGPLRDTRGDCATITFRSGPMDDNARIELNACDVDERPSSSLWTSSSRVPLWPVPARSAATPDGTRD